MERTWKIQKFSLLILLVFVLNTCKSIDPLSHKHQEYFIEGEIKIIDRYFDDLIPDGYCRIKGTLYEYGDLSEYSVITVLEKGKKDIIVKTFYSPYFDFQIHCGIMTIGGGANPRLRKYLYDVDIKSKEVIELIIKLDQAIIE